MNYFKHLFLEYNSSYIPAFGTEFRVTKNYIESGFGRDRQDKNAKNLSTIEAFGRYINMYDRKGIATVKSDYKSMKNAIDPKSMILHSNKEYSNPDYKLKKYSDDLVIDWVEGKNITKRKNVFIPKNGVWFGEKNKNENSNIFSFETSNGMAIGGTRNEATLYGIYELIERDSFLRAWYGKTLVQEVEWHGLGLNEIEALAAVLEQKKQFIHIFDITGETGIPVYWAMLKSENKEDAMAIYNAAGCNANPVNAIKTAILEVLTSFPIYEKILKHNKKLSDRASFVQKNPKNVTKFQDHVLYYASHENAKYFNYLLNRNKKRVNLKQTILDNKNIKKEMEGAIAKLADCKYDVLRVDVTPEFLKQEGLIGVKTIIPGLLPMTFGDQYRRIDINCLSSYNKLHSQELKEVNKLPHPFP